MRDHALSGACILSLRPVGGHGALRHAAAMHGARVLALSPWKLVRRGDRDTRSNLRTALACERIVFASPAAVRAADALQPLHARRAQVWCAVGAGTAAALGRAGIDNVVAPQRMDSEGLLALPQLHDVRDIRVGLVTAPGGRDLIEPGLRARGAAVVRVDLYDRVPTALSPRALQALRALEGRPWLALSSAGALEQVIAALPADALRVFRNARVLAASARLAELARAQGFRDIVIADSARPRDLLAAAARLRGGR